MSKNDSYAAYKLYGESGSVSCIQKQLSSSCENAVAIGFYLDEIKRYDFWKESNTYKEFKSKIYMTKSGITKYTEYTFYDFCMQELGLSRRSVDRYMNIFKAFSSVSSSGVRQKFVDEKYKDYSCSQLAEMLGLSEKVKEKVKPDMSVKQIRELKNEFKEKEEPETFENIDKDTVFEDKVFKKKKYHACGLIYDKYVSTPSQYTQQFIQLQEYLNQGYLVRLLLYAPEGKELEQEVV